MNITGDSLIIDGEERLSRSSDEGLIRVEGMPRSSSSSSSSSSPISNRASLDTEIDINFGSALPVHTSFPHYDFWVIFFLQLPILLLFALLFTLFFLCLFTTTVKWWPPVIVGIFLLICLYALYAALPRRYEIYFDKVVLVQGFPIQSETYLLNIKHVNKAKPKLFNRHTFGLTTSKHRVVTIETTSNRIITLNPFDP